MIDRLYKPFEVDKQNQITNEPSEKTGPNNEKLILNSKGQYYYIEKDSGNAVIYYPVKTDVGIIRNMVFPIEKFKTHFANTPSLRQGLRNFWCRAFAEIKAIDWTLHLQDLIGFLHKLYPARAS